MKPKESVVRKLMKGCLENKQKESQEKAKKEMKRIGEEK